jgi:hypothetical protein
MSSQTTLCDTHIQRQLTRFNGKRDLVDSRIGKMQLQFLLCNTNTNTINQRCQKRNNQPYLVAARVRRLETTTKSAAAPAPNRQSANSDKNQATTYRRAYNRCYNSSRINPWGNTDCSRHKSCSAGSCESRRYFATPWSIYDQKRKISVAQHLLQHKTHAQCRQVGKNGRW